ncbi:hypothetical protein [Actinomadura sp. 9N407]|uniref:hypothetical protein n=1 Tax=Actinomadura sp. 9N407 TaxID=3375154 RepID=UPI0037AA47E3
MTNPGKDRRKPSLAVLSYGVVSMLALVAVGLGSAIREYGPTARSADGDGYQGVFTAHTLHCSKGSNCSWYGTFDSDRNDHSSVQLRGLDDDAVERGQQVAALDVGSREFVFAVGGSADWGTMVGVSIFTLLMGAIGTAFLVLLLRWTPWARLRHGVRLDDLARNGRAAAAGLLARDRWGPFARPRSVTRIRMARSSRRTLLWTIALPVLGAFVVTAPVMVVEELERVHVPEQKALLLWVLSVAFLLLFALVQVIRLVLFRPRIWLADEELLIWDSVMLWKVARIRRADIGGTGPSEGPALYLSDGERAELSPFEEPLNLDIVLRTDVHLPVRRLRWGNWIWLLSQEESYRGLLPAYPHRDIPFRRIAIRAADPERAVADLGRWLSRDRPEPPVREPGFEPADHFFHGKQAAFHGSGPETVKVKGTFPQPVVAEISTEKTGDLRATVSRTVSGRVRPLASNGPCATVVLDDGVLGGPAGNVTERFFHIEARGPWTVKLAGPEAAREFDGSASGAGAELLSYVGPPGIATISANVAGSTGGTYDVTLRGPDLTSRYGKGPTAYSRASGPMAFSRRMHKTYPLEKAWIAMPAGALLQVRAHGGEWRINVLPLERSPGGVDVLLGPGARSVRSFDLTIEGRQASVLLYTGPSGLVQASYRGKGAFRVDRVSTGMAPVEPLVRATGDHSGFIDVESGSLLQISGAPGRWSLLAVVK